MPTAEVQKALDMVKEARGSEVDQGILDSFETETAKEGVPEVAEKSKLLEFLGRLIEKK